MSQISLPSTAGTRPEYLPAFLLKYPPFSGTRITSLRFSYSQVESFQPLFQSRELPVVSGREQFRQALASFPFLSPVKVTLKEAFPRLPFTLPKGKE